MKCTYTFIQCFIFATLPFHAFFSYVLLRDYYCHLLYCETEALGYGFTQPRQHKIMRETQVSPGSELLQKAYFSNATFDRNTEKNDEAHFYFLKIFFMFLVHCQIFQVISCQLADKLLLLSKWVSSVSFYLLFILPF